MDGMLGDLSHLSLLSPGYELSFYFFSNENKENGFLLALRKFIPYPQKVCSMSRLIALILSLILLPFICLLLLLSMIFQGRPVFFVQERVGRDRKPFRVYKLRTMEGGKVTAFGSLLRKSGLDELPQLLDVLKGEMAFVGPRPLTEEDIHRLGWNGPEFDIRWSVLPGMTGPAQVSPVCSRENTWKLDEEYCRHPGMPVKLRILTRTLLRVLSGKSEVR